MTYQAWTPKHVELRILEAAETLMKCPPAKGPQIYGNAMPEPVRKMFQDAAPTRLKYFRKAEPGAISRMEQTWEWINTYLAEGDRHIIYGWSIAKKKRGRSVGRFARENHWSTSTLYRVTRRVCSRIAEKLNENRVPNLTSERFCAESPVNQIRSDISVNRSPRHWIAENGRPGAEHFGVEFQEQKAEAS